MSNDAHDIAYDEAYNDAHDIDYGKGYEDGLAKDTSVQSPSSDYMEGWEDGFWDEICEDEDED